MLTGSRGLAAEDLRGTVKSVDRVNSRMVVHDELAQRDVVVNFNNLTALNVEQEPSDGPQGREARCSYRDHGFDHRFQGHRGGAWHHELDAQPDRSSAEFWHNFRHNLFKPLLLFFYLGFLVPILRVHFEFPYVMYQALTIYLLIAIGWHGGEELAHLDPATFRSIVGFMFVGFVTNTSSASSPTSSFGVRPGCGGSTRRRSRAITARTPPARS